MGFSNRDLDRLAEDIYKNRRISGSIYCGQCGYNLRTLPYVHRCPECGQGYNARPMSMKGIFNPADAGLPIGDMFAVIFWAVLAYLLIWAGLAPRQTGFLLAGAFPVIMCMIQLALMFRRFNRFRAVRSISKRIIEEEANL